MSKLCFNLHACHGANGGGGVGPMLAGQTASMITDKLIYIFTPFT